MSTQKEVDQARIDYLHQWFQAETELNTLRLRAHRLSYTRRRLAVGLSVIAVGVGIFSILDALLGGGDLTTIDPTVAAGVMGAVGLIVLGGPIIGGSKDDKDKIPPPPGDEEAEGRG